MASFCSVCGAALRETSRFCPGCGRPVAVSTPGPPPPAVAPPPPSTVAYLPPPPPPPGAVPAEHPAVSQAGAAAAWAFSNETDALPPAPSPWPLELTLAGYRDSMLAFLERSGCGRQTMHGRALQRTVRAAMLDSTVYREVAVDPSATLEALAVVAVAVAGGVVGPALLSATLGRGLSVSWLVQLLGIQAAALAGFAATVMALSPMLTSVRLRFLTFLRPLAYAEVPGLLSFVPMVGGLLSLWRLVTTVGALRSVLGCQAGKAVGLLLAGMVGGAVAGSAAWPLMRMLKLG